MKLKTSFAVILAAIAVLLCLTGCEDTSKTELFADNSEEISGIISVLKEKYDLADVDMNNITLKGDGMSGGLMENSSLGFSLYFDSNDREGVSDAVGYVLKNISPLCADGKFSTVLCIVYMNADEGYVVHNIGLTYYDGSSDDVSLSLTELDSDLLGGAYEQLMSDYGIKPHRVSAKDGISCCQPALEIRQTVPDNWSSKASVSVDKALSEDELKKIGERVHSLMSEALDAYTAEIGRPSKKTDYEIYVYAKDTKLHGRNSKDSDTMVWES